MYEFKPLNMRDLTWSIIMWRYAYKCSKTGKRITESLEPTTFPAELTGVKTKFTNMHLNEQDCFNAFSKDLTKHVDRLLKNVKSLMKNHDKLKQLLSDWGDKQALDILLKLESSVKELPNTVEEYKEWKSKKN